ncbi:membrane protein [Mycobacterium phage Nanosmite]|nr:membrane protein [Mycobacterium phage Nanosmite]
MTNKLKAAFAAILLIPVGAMVAACGTTPPGSDSVNQDFGVSSNPHYVNLPDGRRVLCVYETRSAKDGGPSCDWEHAK